jgi:rhamnosyltransferase
MTKRIAIAFFYDDEGIIDDYMLHLLQSMQPFVEKTIFVSNGPLSKKSETSVEPLVDEVIIRKNEGFDVWAYKTAIEHIGYDRLAEYDELVLYNHTFFGPIFPFSELFDEMDTRHDDFWGISIHGEKTPNPFTGIGILPLHINSHFIVIRRSILSSKAFKFYWDEIPKIESYTDSILVHESRFTKYFADLGYTFSSYVNPAEYGSSYPVFLDIAEAVAKRCPILKRRLFFHDPLFHEFNAIDLPRAMRLIEQESNYDQSLIWRNIVRTTQPRTLNTNASLLRILPDISVNSEMVTKWGRVAVCAHIYYVEMLQDLLAATNHIPVEYDFIATTDNESKKALIEAELRNHPGIKNIVVRVVEQNRGRDMSALFITCRDLFLDDRYDFVCRLHTKKSPQVGFAQGVLFKRHLVENLLYSSGYVKNLLGIFQGNPCVGLILPPVVHISYPTMGNAWFGNYRNVKSLLDELKIKVPMDFNTPVAPYGTMFWFRPRALRKLFVRRWKWEEFNKEPDHIDGGLAHALERTIGYAVQDAGYINMHVMNADQASYNYSMLEYKMQQNSMVQFKGVRHSLLDLKSSIARSLQHRSPILFRVTRKIYRTIIYAFRIVGKYVI